MSQQVVSYRSMLSNSQLESVGQGHSRDWTVPVLSHLVKCHGGNKGKWKSCFAFCCCKGSQGLLPPGMNTEITLYTEPQCHKAHSLTFSSCCSAYLRVVLYGNSVVVLKKHANVQTYEHLLRASVCMYMCEWSIYGGPIKQIQKYAPNGRHS